MPRFSLFLRTTGVLLAAGLLAAACERGATPPPADRLIVPGERLGVVPLGASRTEVRQRLGPPDGTWAPPNDTGVELDLWGPAGQPHLVVYYQHDAVVQVHTTDPAYATADGFSRRSTVEAVKAHFSPLRILVNPYEENTAYYDATDRGLAFVATFEEEAATGELVGTMAAVFVHRPGQEVLIY